MDKQKLIEANQELVNRYKPKWAVTLTYPSVKRSSEKVQKDLDQLVKILRRRAFGSHALKKIKSDNPVEPAIFSVFEKNDNGGLHIHFVGFEPEKYYFRKNNKRTVERYHRFSEC